MPAIRFRDTGERSCDSRLRKRSRYGSANMKGDGKSLWLANRGRSSMIVTQAIREANSAREVYLLLSAYLAAVRLGGEMSDPFLEIATAPLVSMEDVKRKPFQLYSMLQAVSKRPDDKARGAVKEALYVVSAVLASLKALEERTDR